jgi:hypothetical protein
MNQLREDAVDENRSAVIFFAVSAIAQDQSAALAAEAACGPHSVEFRIKTENSQHPVVQPDPRKDNTEKSVRVTVRSQLLKKPWRWGNEP